ncbi:unnamed protein product [Heterobilharzia americana]|nr:unnamed protein product [Heterobilharzia americana]
MMQTMLDEATDPWGVKVERVEVKDVRLPVQLQRAMAAEAEAAREARAKVIAAEGEWKASRALKEAADVITLSPFAIQLRYLQTLSTISAEKNSTIIFPLPVDLVTHFMHNNRGSNSNKNNNDNNNNNNTSTSVSGSNKAKITPPPRLVSIISGVIPTSLSDAASIGDLPIQHTLNDNNNQFDV